MRRVNWGRIFSFLGGVVFWIMAIGVLLLLSGRVRQHLDSVVVQSISVNVVDSTKMSHLITTQIVIDMLKDEAIIGKPMRELNLTKIEDKIASNGFVESVDVYCSYRGDMSIDVRQREAVVRLMIDGYNCYVNRDGYVFLPPTTTVLYTPIVTGKFPLIIPRGFVGSVDDYMLEQMAKIEEEISQIEFEKHPILLRERDNNRDKQELRRQYTSKKTFETREEYVTRFTDLRIENQRKRELYAYRQRQIDRELELVEKRIKVKRDKQRQIMKQCDDIHNLITLVEMLESDRFWRGEVVQLVVSEGDRGEMRVSMEVRSGRFSVTLGELFDRHGLVARSELSTMELLKEQQQRVIDRSLYSKSSESRLVSQYRATERKLVRKSVDAKLDRVRYFYDEALERVGWDLYRNINVEFENQIVCRK